MLRGKTVLLGVSSSIAAYKAAALASLLKKQGASVHVIMTKNAVQFISPLTFEELTGNRCVVDTFDRNFTYQVEHVALAKQADLAIVAPATANVLAKLSWGLADDMLTTTLLACRCPKLAAPAMNTAMYENPVTQDNLKRLKAYGWILLEPSVGLLACGDVGAGKMMEPADMLPFIQRELAFEKTMTGKKVLVTAGPTQESIDPVRYITNHSTGKMGYAIARAAAMKGAEVTLVSGPTALPAPPFVERVDVRSAREMFEAVTGRSREQDLIIMAAAVADYRPAEVSKEKIKKKDSSLELSLEKTDDILKYLGEHKNPGQLLCGFAMETQNLLRNAREKLVNKHLDLIVANSLKVAGAGFAGDTNVVTLITDKEEQPLELMTKDEVAVRILDKLLSM